MSKRSTSNMRPSRQRGYTRLPRNIILLVLFLFVVPTLYAATPGLPFTEDFVNTTLQDNDSTTARWSTQEQVLLMTGRQPRYGAFEGSIAARELDTVFDGRAVAHGDVDGDGDIDVVAGILDRPNRLYRNNGDGTFEASTILPDDSYPTAALALGDIDRDGDLDLVEGNEGFNYLYRNEGSGDFAAGELITRAANNTQAVALGDLYNDGWLDLVTGNNGQLNLIYLNDSRGNLEASGPITTDAERTRAIALGDVNNDGFLDVAVGNENAQANKVYRNTGGGSFATGTTISADTDDTRAIALGDVDGDRDLDIVAGNVNQANRLYRNTGSGSFVAAGNISIDTDDTTAIALGDIDTDGDLDLVAGNAGQASRLYLNNGTDTPWVGVTGSDITSDTGNTQAIALADVDSDSDLDLVRVNGGQRDKLYLNAGTFNPWQGTNGSTFSSDTNARRAVAMGDINNDGWLDLVVGNNGQRNQVYLNDGSSAFLPGSDISTAANNTQAVALGDVDNDGWLDLVAGNDGQRNQVYLNDGSGSFAAGSDIDTAANNTRTVALGDVDNDGDLDVVAGNSGQPNRVYLNDGSGSFAAGSDIATAANATQAVALGDVDGDGDLDVVAGNDGQPNRLYLNNGNGSFAAGSDITTAANATQAVALGDVNNDGWLDMVAGNSGQRNRVYLNNGNGSLTFGTNVTNDTNATQAIALGDIDENGALDLVAANDGQRAQFYLNNETTTPWGRFILETIASARSTYAVDLGDVDGDGDLDLIQGNAGEPNCLYRNNGTDNPWNDVSCEDITTATNDTQAVALGDIDGDGDLDLVVGNLGQTNHLYRNDGSGTFTAGGALGSVEKDTRAVVLGDVDNDGDLDIVTGNGSRELNRLYLNNGSGSFSAGTTIGSTPEGDLGDDTWSTTDLALGDVNNDGWLDLVSANFISNRLYLNNGSGGFLAGSDIETNPDIDNPTTSVALADMNNDGDLDILVGNDDQDNLLYRNDGSGVFASVTNLDASPVISRKTQSVRVVDIDHDGDLDVVTGELDDFNRLYRNNGNGSFSSPTDISNVASATRSIAAGDITNNGLPGVVAGNLNQTSRLSYRLKYNTVASMAQSLTTDTSSTTIPQVGLEVSDNLPVNTGVNYWVSNDGGSRWLLIQPGDTMLFPSAGSDLRWRAELHSLSPAQTPDIEEITLTSEPLKTYLPLVRK